MLGQELFSWIFILCAVAGVPVLLAMFGVYFYMVYVMIRLVVTVIQFNAKQKQKEALTNQIKEVFARTKKVV